MAQMALPANQANLACLGFKENKAMMDLLAEADLLVNLVCQAPLDCRDDPDLKDSMDSLDLMDHKDRKEALVQLALASTARDTTKVLYIIHTVAKRIVAYVRKLRKTVILSLQRNGQNSVFFRPLRNILQEEVIR